MVPISMYCVVLIWLVVPALIWLCLNFGCLNFGSVLGLFFVCTIVFLCSLLLYFCAVCTFVLFVVLNSVFGGCAVAPL